ncbi:alpha-1,6-glucosidase [Arthrobacter sp. SW1]|uniref:pullulanase-type alpha-1,6-glucosidase n=1 Tax=Arthrobacter sp. SW1 TaxID=1920889 RepID=UPI000877C714|nr:pullulanase-type alpha-1,6-glucosidase [Arthrobacter sp. SW1]OFI38370.1 alpha-1,6-glucosidase [Arthrobacter sp. SW1]
MAPPPRSSLHKLARPATAVAGLTPLILGGLALPASADHTAAPVNVALVGSLQSELGCPGDWQPECPATALQPVEGSPGLYRGTFTVPAGSYEYKVALNNSWTENYGAGGAAGGANLPLAATGGTVTFTYDHATHTITDDVPKSVGAGAAAHWLDAGTLVWKGAPAAAAYRLYASPDGGITLVDGKLDGGEALGLSRQSAGLGGEAAAKFPHLAGTPVLTLSAADAARAKELLKGQLVVAALDEAGNVVGTTGVQLPGVLDSLYPGAAQRGLGLNWQGGKPSLALWAPTARNVRLHVYSTGSGGEAAAVVPMQRDADGVWTAAGNKGWKGSYYLYEVEVYVPETGEVELNAVTDPYSLGLSTNSERSLFLDPADKALAPAGWSKLAKPALATPEDLSIYELHVRDFSIADQSVPAAHRGTYKAFTDTDSKGMSRLKEQIDAGINAVHLLPVNDIATIEERRELHQEPACDLASLPPASEEQQACVSAIAAKDGFNWGYDPLHYGTPEGSYSTNPEGATRTLEFREMVAALNKAGARVVQDVVYNHTSGAGQNSVQNLDRIVPGYYHRLNPDTGTVETSTCCANTATEHAMMGKLMTDTLVSLAKTYKLDGFRFDLMGHHSKQNLLDVRAALDALTLKKDGVDGKGIYLYGEGWNFGEVANNARFEQATQLNMAGTGIGTFTDRLRDAVRGGGPFDDDPRIQGFGSGLFTDPNASPANGSSEAQLQSLLLAQDQIKVGLTGNLAGYTFTDRTGATVKGSDVSYNGQPAGYTQDPQEAITYVEAHDNETLFDALAFKLPPATSMADRIRMQHLALSTTALGQGVSFWHAGTEALRSKSLDRNSYDSGDWFNAMDHTDAGNGFAKGLPPITDNGSKYQFMTPLLEDPALKPTTADLATARAGAAELLRIRKGTPLFHLGTAELVQQKVSFPLGGPSQTPGVIVMKIDDTAGPDVDPSLKGLVVVFNASDEATTQAVPGTAGYELHPVQAGGHDPVVKTASFNAGSFTVPARTVAVFVSK